MAKAKTPKSNSPKVGKKPKTFVDHANAARNANKKSFVFRGVTYELTKNSKGLPYYGPK